MVMCSNKPVLAVFSALILIVGGLAAAAEQAAPTQAAADKAAPTQAVPEQAAADQAAPTQAVPEQATPVQAAPVQAAPTQAAPDFVKGKPVILNFQDAPLDAVLQYLSETEGFTVVKQVEVSGRVSVVSRQPLNADEAIAVLNTVL